MPARAWTVPAKLGLGHTPGRARTSRPTHPKPTTRSTLTLISRQHLWPSSRRHPGIANGWQGAAWVAFKLAAAGVAVPQGVFESIGPRLADDMARTPPNHHIGAMIGCASDAVIAAYAAKRGMVSTAVARRACRRVLSISRSNPLWDVHMGLSGALLAFLESTYDAAADLGKWDREALERRYTRPERRSVTG